MLSALLIAMLTAITVWWLLIQRLKDKPWTKQGVQVIRYCCRLTGPVGLPA